MSIGDDIADGIFRGIALTVAAPFKLGYRAYKISNEQTERDEREKKTAPLREARERARAAQLDALRDAVPKEPPTRMRATIHTNEFKRAQTGHVKKTRLIGDKSYDVVETGETFVFSVDMILQLTETERAIIKQYELDDIVLEQVEKYSEQEISQRQAHLAQLKDDHERSAMNLGKTVTGMVGDKIEEQINEQILSDMMAAKLKTRIGDLLVAPFTRVFEAPHEAAAYATTLKTKLLPRMRQLIDLYAVHKPSETIEF